MSECRVDGCGAKTDGFMCRRCAAQLEQAVGDMRSLLHEVSLVATRQTRVYRANGRGGEDDDVQRWDDEQADIPAWLRSREGRITLPATTLMVNLGARELLWDALNTLGTWSRHLAEARGAEPPASERMVGWLLGNVEAVRFDEAAAEIYDEITYLHARMTRTVDRAPSRVYAGPCHAPLVTGGRCERSLYGWPGADEILCDGFGSDNPYEVGCRASHTVAERQEWMLAAFADALLPLATWLEALPLLLPDLAWPRRSTWWRWQQAGRLPARGLLHDAETFRGGDVIDLVVSEQARIRGNQGKRHCA